MFILTLIVVLICPQIDGYIIGPKIYGKTNQLPAIVNIFAVFAGGVLGGFWGIVISWFPMLLLVGVWIFFMRQANSGNNKAMSFGKSRARLIENNKKVININC